MSKSALIIDTPETCMGCNFFYIDAEECREDCMAREERKLVDLKVYDKPDWCPLKPLPKPIPPERADYAHEASYIEGWNECLEKIMENK